MIPMPRIPTNLSKGCDGLGSVDTGLLDCRSEFLERFACNSVPGGQPERVHEADPSADRVSFGKVGPSQVDVDLRAGCPHPRCSAQHLDRCIDVTPVTERIAEVVVGLCKQREEPDG